jgi:hypothetical protein
MRPSDRIALFIRNVVLHIAFDGDYVWPADPLAAFRPYVTQAPNSSTPLSVRLGADSAMTLLASALPYERSIDCPQSDSRVLRRQMAASWSGFSPRCCRAITNKTDNKCVRGKERNSLCDFKPNLRQGPPTLLWKRIGGTSHSASAAGEEAQAPECRQIMASSPKPPRGEPEFRSTTDCRRPPDIAASPFRGRPSNRPS